MSSAFYWIGVIVVSLFVFASVLFASIWLYMNFLHGRFNMIFFREGERRLSLASWHRSKMYKGEDPSNKDHWPADDWPIGRRPFYLSFRIGSRRLFILIGALEGHRPMVIKGTHP